jgi:hypothetical protein
MYLSHGYLDTWHATATVLLAPVFGGGLWLTQRRVRGEVMGRREIFGRWRGMARVGWWLLLGVSGVMVCAGATICAVGMTAVFVPQDLEYLGTTPAALDALNPRLIPLIAHDRAGFGAGVLNVGFLLLACTWFGRPSRSLWQALAVAGGVGFGCAIGVHPLVGYNNPVHLGPACVGAAGFFVGVGMVAGRMWGGAVKD